jgi:hypothetical protein
MLDAGCWMLDAGCWMLLCAVAAFYRLEEVIELATEDIKSRV